MAQQQVYRLLQRTSFHDLAVVQEPIPTPLEHEVLVKVRSGALNYRDVAICNSTYPVPVKDSVIPCSDLAGDVVQVGSVVEGFAVGDKVIAAFDLNALYGTIPDSNHTLGGSIDGALQQYVCLPASALVKIPTSSKLSYAQWAPAVYAGTTAWNSLYGNVPLKPGRTRFNSNAGTGGVSITGLILARAAGATTIMTSSSDTKLQHVREKYGVDHVINYKTTPSWGAEVQRLTHGLGADHVFESGGAGTIAQSMEAVAQGGIISVIGFLESCPQADMPNVAALVMNKGAVVRGIRVGPKQQLEDLVRFVAARNLELPVGKTFGFSHDQVIAAFEFLTSGQHVRKVYINVQ
ncbi:hypothetical protein QQX98_009994 [Neonectria punicea]|uniref:Enoyl reductase (ER) domain-containing protein n=1 Tax=Neonectria punicea TaxID=979145 RepID=A0ABR1GQM3_9HYPO